MITAADRLISGTFRQAKLIFDIKSTGRIADPSSGNISDRAIAPAYVSVFSVRRLRAAAVLNQPVIGNYASLKDTGVQNISGHFTAVGAFGYPRRAFELAIFIASLSFINQCRLSVSVCAVPNAGAVERRYGIIRSLSRFAGGFRIGINLFVACIYRAQLTSAVVHILVAGAGNFGSREQCGSSRRVVAEGFVQLLRSTGRIITFPEQGSVQGTTQCRFAVSAGRA